MDLHRTVKETRSELIRSMGVMTEGQKEKRERRKGVGKMDSSIKTIEKRYKNYNCTLPNILLGYHGSDSQYLNLI